MRSSKISRWIVLPYLTYAQNSTYTHWRTLLPYPGVSHEPTTQSSSITQSPETSSIIPYVIPPYTISSPILQITVTQSAPSYIPQSESQASSTTSAPVATSPIPSAFESSSFSYTTIETVTPSSPASITLTSSTPTSQLVPTIYTSTVTMPRSLATVVSSIALLSTLTTLSSAASTDAVSSFYTSFFFTTFPPTTYTTFYITYPPTTFVTTFEIPLTPTATTPAALTPVTTSSVIVPAATSISAAVTAATSISEAVTAAGVSTSTGSRQTNPTGFGTVTTTSINQASSVSTMFGTNPPRGSQTSGMASTAQSVPSAATTPAPVATVNTGAGPSTRQPPADLLILLAFAAALIL